MKGRFQIKLPFGRRSNIDKVAPLATEIAKTIEGMHPVARSIVFLMSNLQLISIARARSATLVRNPAQCPDEPLENAIADARAVFKMLDNSTLRKQIEADRYQRVHALCVKTSAGLLAATFAILGRGGDRRTILLAWRQLWEERTRAEQAINWLRERETALNIEVFPKKADGKQYNDIELLQVATQLPPFLRRGA